MCVGGNEGGESRSLDIKREGEDVAVGKVGTGFGGGNAPASVKYGWGIGTGSGRTLTSSLVPVSNTHDLTRQFLPDDR